MRRIFLILATLSLTGAAAGQAPVTASLSSDRVATSEMFTLTISANGSDVKEPDLTGVMGLGIQLGTPSHQSSTSIRQVQGQTTVVQSRTWRYPATVSRVGDLTLPRIPIVVDGKEYFTAPMRLEVVRGLDLGARAPDSDAEITVDDLAFVRAAVDKATVYQGEAVTLRLRLFRLGGNAVRIEGPRSLPAPSTEGFYPGPQWQHGFEEQYKNRQYEVTEFCQVHYPAMPGEATIGAWNWQGTVRWNDARRRPQAAARVFTTNPIPITVLPLPGRPDGFSGAVGKFKIQAQLAQDQLTQGTPVRFTITVSGEGNPSALAAPVLPDMPWAHISGPDVEARQREQSAESIKEFSYLITPLNVGEHTIPAVEFTYFAPIIKNYKTESTNAYEVVVQPAQDGNTFVAVGGSAEARRQTIQVFDNDLWPVIADPASVVYPFQQRNATLSVAALASPAIPAILLALAAWYARHRRRLTLDQGYARKYHGQRRCEKALAAARQAPDPTEAVFRALTAFVADMLNLNEAGMTSHDVEALLREQTLHEEAITVIAKVLRACERARYAGGAPGAGEIEALLDAALEATETLRTALQERQS